jgi:hypothetical protein
MSHDNPRDQSEPAGFDPDFTRRMIDAARPVGKGWFRWEAHGFGSFPTDGGPL